MVRSSLWEKATREFDPHLPEKLLFTNRDPIRLTRDSRPQFYSCSLVVVAQR